MEEIKEQFDGGGYVILNDFLDSAIVEKAPNELERLVDHQAQRLLKSGKINDPLSTEPFETRLARLFEHFPEDAPALFRPELHLPGLFYLFFHPGLIDVVEGFLGPRFAFTRITQSAPSYPITNLHGSCGIKMEVTPRDRWRN